MIDYQPKIMAVDDTPANLKLLEEMLRARGCQVRSFSCGRLALAAAATEPPDLILLDINMPEMNGYEVCCQLKADAKLATIPVIFISVLSETLDKVKAFGCGGVDYVTKPFQFAEVYARVETHLKLRWLQRELERQNQQLKESYDRLREIEDLSDLTLVRFHIVLDGLLGQHRALGVFVGRVADDGGKIPNDEDNLMP